MPKVKKIVPFHDQVVVKVIEEDIAPSGTIVVPDTAKEKPQIGKVIAVGPGRYSDAGTLIPMTVKEGQTVMFGKYDGMDVKVGDEEYKVLKELSLVLQIIFDL